MACTSVTQDGRKCKRPALIDGRCCVHHSQTCAVCLEPVPSLNSKGTKRLSCTHAFHTQCILTWFETSDECPTCRTEQDTDSIIIFKKHIEDNLRVKYQDAIRSLQHEVNILRMRRPRNLFPRRELHDDVYGDYTAGGAV
jgi:hypothetical protein